MALLTDGLWISDMSLVISRNDAPIPEGMKKNPIKVELTNTQIIAIASVLGLGLENGDVVCYNDTDLDEFMQNPNDSLIRDKYKLMTAKEIKSRRVAAKAFKPMVNNKTITDIWNEDGMIDDNMEYLNGDGTTNTEAHVDTDSGN